MKERSIAVFSWVAEAEGKVHGLPAEEVHFHEVGAVDSIVDIVGACIALELLGCPRVFAGPVVEGHGWVDCAHGRFPVPTAATLEILGARGVSVEQCDEPAELVTPTGAAILAEFVESFGRMQGVRADRIGYGLGTRVNKTRPNVLRAIRGRVELGEEPETQRDWDTDHSVLMETNLDDISSEIVANVSERLLAAGALDVYSVPIIMKKGRPGIILSVLSNVDKADSLSELILRETSAFGVRRTQVERQKLRREFVEVETNYGTAVVKIGRLDGQVIQRSPEYDVCVRIADDRGISVKTVYEAALTASQTIN